MRGAGRLAPGPDSVSFEQPIDTEPPGEPAVLRIGATFSESPAGFTVTLRADEIRSHQEQRPRFTAPLRPRQEQS